MIKNFKKNIAAFGLVSMMTFGLSVSVLAASQSLNGGGATWSGGENSSSILYSQIVDNANDGLRHQATVWVENDEGNYKSTTGITTGVGNAGRVRITIGATHSSPFKTERAGYNNYVVVKTK